MKATILGLDTVGGDVYVGEALNDGRRNSRNDIWQNGNVLDLTPWPAWPGLDQYFGRMRSESCSSAKMLTKVLVVYCCQELAHIFGFPF